MTSFSRRAPTSTISRSRARVGRSRRSQHALPALLALPGAVALVVTMAACHRTGRISATNDGALSPDPPGPAPATDPLMKSLAAAATPAPIAGAPYVAYTDLVAGPTSGGENDKGVFLSLFGTNF